MSTGGPASPLDRWLASQAADLEARISEFVDLEAGMNDLAFPAREEAGEAGIQNLVDIERGLSDLMTTRGKATGNVRPRATSDSLTPLVAEVVRAIGDLARSVMDLTRDVRSRLPDLAAAPEAAILDRIPRRLRTLATRLANRNIARERAIAGLREMRLQVGDALQSMSRADPQVNAWLASFRQRMTWIAEHVDVIFDDSGDSAGTPWISQR